MSGHSHWHQIRHKKGAADIKKGKIFSKIARMITVAAKEKGGDPETNPKLRLAIEKAREVNMPKENIEKAIKRGTGELEGTKIEEVTYEAYGPGGIALIIETITDNKNRTISEIKHILSKFGAKLADPGSVSYLFEKKGVITLKKEKPEASTEEIELLAIENGAEDIKTRNGYLEIQTKPENLENLKQKIEENLKPESPIKIESVSLDWIAQNYLETDDKTKEQLEKLFEALDENDDVQEIYSNLKD